MSGTDTAAMVSTRFDVVIDGYGYMFDKRPDVRAEMSYTPTFLDRQNVSGGYGDNEQDFFLTVNQHDWSGGQGQVYWADEDGRRNSYWTGSAVTVRRPGEINIEQNITSITPSADGLAASGVLLSDSCYYVGSTNLYNVSPTGIETSLGAHGAGTPTTWGLCQDGKYLYIAGSSKIRKWVSSSFTDFSTETAAGSLAYLNNALYSCDGSSLKVYDGSGTATTLFTWKDGTNTALAVGRTPKLVAFGATLLIFFPYLTDDRPELWQYDGDGTTKIAELPVGYGGDIVVSEGIAFLSAMEQGQSEADKLAWAQGVIYVYVNGSLNELWRDTGVGSTTPSFPSTLAPMLGLYAGNLVFTVQNSAGKTLRMYDLRAGAVTTLGSMTYTANSHRMASCKSFVMLAVDTGAGTKKLFTFPGGGFTNLGTLTSSLYDFGSSLTKLMRGVIVEWTNSGASASVDIAYRIGDVNGSYTTLQTNATSGTEYLFPSNTTGRSVSIKVTLNDSGDRPTVKRVYVRAAPILQSYRRATYVLDLSGRNGENHVRRWDDTSSSLDGLSMLTNLRAALASVVSITDKIGTFSGVIDTGNFRIQEVRPEEFIAYVPVREV